MEEYLTTHSIYKSLVICDSEETCAIMLQQLIENDHGVSYISPDLIDNDRPLYAHKMRQYALGATRVMLLSYSTWYQIVDSLESYAMDHNLLVLQNLESQEKHVVMVWLMDARNRGFGTRQENYHILFQDETFSVSEE